MAYVIALLAVLALGIAAAFVARSVGSTTAAPRDQSQGTPVCSSSLCDYQRYEQPSPVQEPSLIDIPGIGSV